MRIAAQMKSSFESSTSFLAKRRRLPVAVGVLVVVALLGIACSDQPLPTEVKSPGIVRLNVSPGEGPTVATDLPDYTPGDTVRITGWSWEPGEIVRLQVLHVEDVGDGDLFSHHAWDVTADANGNISSSWLVTDDESGANLKVIADGQTSGAHAEVLFTDLTGSAVLRMFVDASRTTTQSAYPWGATIYPRVTTGALQINICYRVRWFDPSDVVQQTTIVGRGSTSYDVATFTVPTTGPSGTWYAILDQNNGALDCTTASYSGAGDRVNFDVARAVVIGAGTTASDAVIGGDRCVGSTSEPTGCGATGATLAVSSQASNLVRSFLRFDLSAASPAVPAGATINSAKVRLVVSGTAASARTYNMQRASASWNEAGITYANQPALTGSTATAAMATGLTAGAGGGDPQTWVKWTVTNDVQTFLDDPTTNFGWRISDAAEGSGNVLGRFHSTEATGTCDTGSTCTRTRPVLLIDYTPGPTKLAFTNTAFTDRVGECFGPFTVQSQDPASAALAVTTNTTVSLSTDGTGGFFSNSSCTTGITSVQIDNGSYDSPNFYYRPTARGDGTHELTADDTSPNRLTSSTQTQTVNKALTSLTYTGDLLVLIGNTFTMKALLTSDFEGCISGKTVIWGISPNPETLAAGFWFPGNTTTNSSGVATKVLSTSTWNEGIYDGRANFPGDANCEASKDDPAFTVLAPGNAATGGGFLAGSKVGGGRANFGFNVRPIEGSDPIAFKGQFLLIKQNGGVPVFRCKGALTNYGVTGDLNVATGTCDFQIWNPALNGGLGDWEVPYGPGYTNRPFTIYFKDFGSGKGKTAPPPDQFGFTINFVGNAIPDPSFAIAEINGGNIDVKSSATTTTTTSGGGGKRK